MRIGYAHRHVLIKSVVECDVKGFFVLFCIDCCALETACCIIPDRQSCNRIAHPRPVVVDGKGGMLRELLAHAERPDIAAFILQRRIEYTIYRGVVSLAQRAVDLRPSEIHAECVVKEELCIECRRDEARLSLALHGGSGSRGLIARVVGVAQCRCQIPVRRDVDLVLYIGDYRVARGMRLAYRAVILNALCVVLCLVIGKARNDIVLADCPCVLHLEAAVALLAPAGRLLRRTACLLKPFLHLRRIAAREWGEVITDPLFQLRLCCPSGEVCLICCGKIVDALTAPITPAIIVAVGVAMVLVVDAQEALHAVVLVECPLELPVVVLKLAEGVIDSAVEGKEVRISGVFRIAGKPRVGNKNVARADLSDGSRKNNTFPVILIPIFEPGGRDRIAVPARLVVVPELDALFFAEIFIETNVDRIFLPTRAAERACPARLTVHVRGIAAHIARDCCEIMK